MLYEMIIMSSTSQLYCQTKMNLKKVICSKQITFFCHFLQKKVTFCNRYCFVNR